jgi:hypothetical protein
MTLNRLHPILRAVLPLLVLLAAGPAAFAGEPASIQLTVRPPRAVADGSSFVTVTANVRDGAGRLVADGEIVSFSATLGNIEATAATKGGQASAQLTAPNIPGTSVVTVSSGRAVAETRVVFTRPGASEIRPTRAVVVTGDYLVYDDAAKAVDVVGKARIEAGGVRITGDRAQIILAAGSAIVESRPGSNGTEVRDGSRAFRADRVRYDWASRDGYAMGITDPVRGMHYFSAEDLKPVPTSERFIVSPFETRTTGDSPLLIRGARLVLEPGVEMVFNRADIILGGKRRFSLPVFVFPIGPARQGDPRYIGVGPEGPLLDLPYTFAAGARGVAQARLKYNAPEGLYGSYVSGWALDLLSRYSLGGATDGTLELNRVTSTDRGFTWTHNQSFSPSLQGYVSLDTRASTGLSTRYTLANASLNYRARPYTVSLSAFGSDVNVTTGTVRLALQTRPRRLNSFLSWNAGADLASTWYLSTKVNPDDPAETLSEVRRRETTGLSARLSTPSLKLAPGATLNATAGAGVSWSGSRTKQTVTGSVGYSQALARGAQLRVNYNYSDLDQGPTQILYNDPVTNEPRVFYLDTVEKQTVSTSLSYGAGAWSGGVFATHGIDQASWSGRLTSQYRFGRDWSLQGSYGYFRQQVYVFDGAGTEPVRQTFSQTSWQVRLERALGERALAVVYDTYNRKVYLEYVPGRLF